MADTQSSILRSVLVIGAITLWVIGLVWVLHRKGIVAGPRSDADIEYGVDDAADEGGRRRADDEPVSEIVVQTEPEPEQPEERARVAGLAKTNPEPELEPEGPPTFPVWFESVRDIGVCKISYEGGAKTANLHVDTRLPQGQLSFSYQCGSHRGRGSIDVKPNRVNGVLFCEKADGVTVKTVRSKDARCKNR